LKTPPSQHEKIEVAQSHKDPRPTLPSREPRSAPTQTNRIRKRREKHANECIVQNGDIRENRKQPTRKKKTTPSKRKDLGHTHERPADTKKIPVTQRYEREPLKKRRKTGSVIRGKEGASRRPKT